MVSIGGLPEDSTVSHDDGVGTDHDLVGVLSGDLSCFQFGQTEDNLFGGADDSGLVHGTRNDIELATDHAKEIGSPG